MINEIPSNWKYNDSLEMLYLFYQKTDELLSETTPDTYALPLHNSITLFNELNNTYELLIQNNMLDSYYSNYIIPIINELLYLIENDFIIKKMMGMRLESIKTGFLEATKDPKLLERWMNVFKQTCSARRYRELYKEEIVSLVKDNSKNKEKLLECTTRFFVSLARFGYSREYLYSTTKRFFSNTGNQIKSSNQISDFLSVFDFKEKEYEFLILLNLEAINYINEIGNGKFLNNQMQEIDLKKERENLLSDDTTKPIMMKYDELLKKSGEHDKLAIVRYKSLALDPYTLAQELKERIELLLTFKRYFIHFTISRQIHMILLRRENKGYYEIKLKKPLRKRPFISKEIIDSRVKDLLQRKSMSFSTFQSFLIAFQLHSEALDSKSTSVIFKTFWTALETIFYNNSPNLTHHSVIDSTLPIIQKTYILKLLRSLYFQIRDAIGSDKLTLIGIKDFNSFVVFFATYESDSEEIKKIFNLLEYNPLLRSRLYSLRKNLSTGAKIAKYLNDHNTRIKWQLQRLYRIRNIATHLGESVPEMDIAIDHLHNYFDYVVNYMLCKSENGNYIASATDVVFESQNDIRIHNEILKKEKDLSANNYQELLFGPDQHLIKYKFEHWQ